MRRPPLDQALMRGSSGSEASYRDPCFHAGVKCYNPHALPCHKLLPQCLARHWVTCELRIDLLVWIHAAGRVSAGDVATSLLLSDGSTGAEAGGATAWWALQGGQQQEQQPGWLGLAPPGSGSGSGSGCGSGCATPTANGTALTDHVAAAGGSVGGGWVHATVPWVAANGGPSAPGSDSAKPLRITDPLNKHGSLLTTNGQAYEVSCMLPESSHVSGLAAIDSGSRCPDPWPAGPPTRAGGTAVPAPTCDLPASRELQPPSPSSPAFNCPRSREPGAGEGAARDRQGAPGTGWPGGGEAHAGAAGSSGGQAAGGKLADRWLLFEVADTGAWCWCWQRTACVVLATDGLRELWSREIGKVWFVSTGRAAMPCAVRTLFGQRFE